jgi:hypothetical protein
VTDTRGENKMTNKNTFGINEDGSAVFNGSLNSTEIYISDKFKKALELINAQISKVQVEQNKHDAHSNEYKTSLEDESAMLKIKLAVTGLLTDQKNSK